MNGVTKENNLSSESTPAPPKDSSPNTPGEEEEEEDPDAMDETVCTHKWTHYQV